LTDTPNRPFQTTPHPALQAGLAPAERDEDGKEINPHIPQFMAAAPWYLEQKAGLKHQKAWNAVDKKEGEGASGSWYKRGVKTFQATKFRKGACENCGAMTHKRKDCVERPRAVNAKKSQRDIAADELVQDDVRLGFEQKRDRYNGFDASEYSRVVDKFERAEKLKEEAAKKRELEKKFKSSTSADEKKEGDGEKGESDAKGDDDDDDSGDSDSDSELAGDKDAQGFMKVNKRVRTAGGGASMTVRNLRIREDTAKYLRNLDLQSAHYDPKTRSMRENPTPDDHPSDAFVRGGEGGGKSSALQKFAGDNVNRGTGEAVGFERLAGHASAAFDKGQEIHPQAGPSAAELLYKQFREKKSKLAEQTRSSILDTYGDASVKQPAPEGLLLGQTEAYSEYDRAGRLLRGAERAAQKSRYEEDVLDQNHTHVWGSFWSGGRWGYACCRSHQKGSYCTGAKGIAAAAAAGDLMLANLERREAARAAEEAAREQSEKNDPGSVHASVSGMRNPFGDASKWGEKEETVADVALDPQKLMKALREEDARLRTGGEEEERRSGDEAKKKKRAYNADREEAEPTEEEMEAFRMKRKRENDPMAEKESLGTKGYDLV